MNKTIKTILTILIGITLFPFILTIGLILHKK